MLFGSEKTGGVKGIALDTETLSLKQVDVPDGDWQKAGVIVHNVTNRAVAHMLVDLRVAPKFADFPMALGVIYDDPRPSFEAELLGQDARVNEGKTPDLAKLLAKGQTWTVDA